LIELMPPTWIAAKARMPVLPCPARVMASAIPFPVEPEAEGEAYQVDRAFHRMLARAGFGVLTRIDVKDTLDKKIGTDFRPYVMLGACNPKLAYGALRLEDKIGTMLPCNVRRPRGLNGCDRKPEARRL
jgi:hypothetical protein